MSAELGPDQHLHSIPLTSRRMIEVTHPVLHSLLPESIATQSLDISLDHLEVLLPGEHPQIALTDANAAIAFTDRRDLRDLNLVDECAAVAVSTVSL